MQTQNKMFIDLSRGTPSGLGGQPVHVINGVSGFARRRERSFGSVKIYWKFFGRFAPARGAR